MDRLVQYKNAINRYITESFFTDIVFVENSGYPFPIEKYKKLAIEYGKRFEFIYRKLSNEEVSIMQERGKSWGEADLIDYALNISRLIAETDVIYKCTGRIFLTNSKKIIKKAYKQSEFIKWVKYPCANTAFFKILKKDYYDYLFGAKYEVNDRSYGGHFIYDANCIEKVFYAHMINSKMRVKAFRIIPRLEGIEASSNKNYARSKCYYLIYDLIPYCFKKLWRIK